MSVAPLNPPERMLCGPGPANVAPTVLDAMRKPILGHMDPDLADINAELVQMLRDVYQAADAALVLPLQATGTSGMEAGLAHLLEPGETAIVGVNGFFGRRIVEIAGRLGAEVVQVGADWGQPVANDALLQALEDHPAARVVAVVHAETSTGVEHPLAELGARLRDRDAFLLADCVTALGGIEVDFDGWGVDFAYSCTQKCLGAPPGMSPVAVSRRAWDRIERRTTPISYSLDLRLLRDYWVTRPPAYHHTAPVLHIYALHQGLRDVLDEGLQPRWERHRKAGAHLQRSLRERELELLADPDRQLPQLTAVRVPEGVDAAGVQTRLLRDHGIEIGGGLGPSAPSMWRIGLMGHNATTAAADRVLAALDDVL